MSSPTWKNPSELMKKRVVRKRLSVTTTPDAEKPSPKQVQREKKSPITKKRKNPFGCSAILPKKKTSIEVACPVDALAAEKPKLFNALEDSEIQPKVR